MHNSQNVLTDGAVVGELCICTRDLLAGHDADDFVVGVPHTLPAQATDAEYSFLHSLLDDALTAVELMAVEVHLPAK